MPLYSHSRLSTFEQCPLKYKLHYIDKQESVVEQGIEAFMGDLVHRSLEKLYKDLKFQKVLTLNELHDYFRALWKKNFNSGINIVRKEYSPDNYMSMGLKFLEDYYNRYHPFNEGVTIALEDRVIITLDPAGLYKLQGYIDRIACFNNDEYHIIDYKTNSSLKVQEQLDADRQLALYQIAVQNNYKDAKKVILKWHFLAFDKTIISTRTPEQLEALKKDTIKLIDKVESTKNFKPRVSALCDWCEFRAVCPEWSHLYSVEKKDVNEFLIDDGVTLVNKYIELSEKKRESDAVFDKDLDKLKEALIAFAREKGVNVVFGSNNKIRIAFYENFKFPPKGSLERAELVDILKKLKRFDEVADIDIYALSDIVRDESWDADALRIVKKFAVKEETQRLYPGKINTREDAMK